MTKTDPNQRRQQRGEGLVRTGKKSDGFTFHVRSETKKKIRDGMENPRGTSTSMAS